MTLVVDGGREHVGTHVIVMGVGRYPHLAGGDPNTLFAHHGGMGQLDSPPQSALVVADWFANRYRNPEHPLRTIELLVSGEPNAFTPPGGPLIEPEPATLANVKAAVRRWKSYGDNHEENLLVFYFCGHGVSSGQVQALLTEDFGASPDSPFEDAVDLEALRVGMRGAKPKRQVYFIDACQTVSDSYIAEYGGEFWGIPVVAGSVSANLAATEQPTIHAARLGTAAYGEVGQPSFFTRALIAAFEGAAADEVDGEWVVVSSSIAKGVNAFLERMVARKFGREQVATPKGLEKDFDLHVLSGPPHVPVDVTCRDPDRTAEVTFECASGGMTVQTRPSGSPGVWELELPLGIYDFVAKGASGDRMTLNGKIVHPPYKRYTFDCK